MERRRCPDSPPVVPWALNSNYASSELDWMMFFSKSTIYANHWAALPYSQQSITRIVETRSITLLLGLPWSLRWGSDMGCVDGGFRWCQPTFPSLSVLDSVSLLPRGAFEYSVLLLSIYRGINLISMNNIVWVGTELFLSIYFHV
jgi:hypothetical protein